jgi:tetratricopeptide (TPR) repeat protein
MTPDMQFMIGQAVQAFQAGNHMRAEGLLIKILQSSPKNLPALHILGLIKAAESKHVEAADYLLRAVKLDPNEPSLRYNLAKALAASGKDLDSLIHHQRAAELMPQSPEVWLNFGKSLATLGRYQESLGAIEKALNIQPNYLEALINKSAVLNELKQYEESLLTSKHALDLSPLSKEVWSNQGGALKGLGYFTKALEAYEKAIAIDPKYAQAWFNRGVLLKELRRFDEAFSSYHSAININPNEVDAHWNLALLKLATGNFLQGFQEYEWRWKRANAEAYRHKNVSPLKKLGDVAGKKILVWAEQGLGDTIQFSRFMPELVELGAEIIFEVQPLLSSLMERSYPQVKVAPIGEQIEHVDLQIPMLSLPGVFGVDLGDVPNKIPYLLASSEKINFWRQKITGSSNKLSIGIACSGITGAPIPLEKFSEIIPYTNIFLIQKDLKSSDSEALVRFPSIQYLGEQIKTFDDTAGIIENMDLVISVDTSLAHLAGALGKRTWVLLPYVAEWRWLDSRDDSPWYPSMRLYRQVGAGDWDEVMQRVKEDLIILSANKEN